MRTCLVHIVAALTLRRRCSPKGAEAPQRRFRRCARAAIRSSGSWQSLAVVERKLMIPMRDGVRMQFDVYRPKNVQRAPAIFVRTP